MKNTINYLMNIGCAEHYIESENKTEYWFRVKEKGVWNGYWSKDHKGSCPLLSTNALAMHMHNTR